MQMNLEQQKQALWDGVYSPRFPDMRPHAVKNIIGPYIEPIKPHVTAVGTSGGKTILTAARFEFLYKYGYIKQNEKVLILAADKTILRRNFESQFDKFFKVHKASFSYRTVSSKEELKQAILDDIQVIITIPQTIQDNKSLSMMSALNFKWLVQDEAHKWYFKKTVQNIIKKLKSSKKSFAKIDSF